MTTRNPVLDQIATEIDASARALAQTTAQIAATPALDTADLWRLFRSDSRAAWTALAGLTKEQLVVQAVAMAAHLYDAENTLISADAVLTTWQSKLSRRATAAQVAQAASDLPIPSLDTILTVAQERGETAQRYGDDAGIHQLDRVRMNLLRGAALRWHRGDLLIQSVNNPGQVYRTNARGCSCPNGRAGKAACWHVALYDLLIDLQEQAAIDADMRADRAAWRDEGPQPPRPPRPAPLGARIAAARAEVLRRAA